MSNSNSNPDDFDPIVQLSVADIDLIRQWFNAVEDLNQSYLESADYDLIDRLLSKKHKRPEWANIRQPNLNGLLCSVCGLPQLDTPSGTSCGLGHGGVEGIEP